MAADASSRVPLPPHPPLTHTLTSNHIAVKGFLRNLGQLPSLVSLNLLGLPLLAEESLYHCSLSAEAPHHPITPPTVASPMSLWGPCLEIPLTSNFLTCAPSSLSLLELFARVPPSRASFRAYFSCLLQEPLTSRAQGLGYLAAPQTKAVGTAFQGTCCICLLMSPVFPSESGLASTLLEAERRFTT